MTIYKKISDTEISATKEVTQIIEVEALIKGAEQLKTEIKKYEEAVKVTRIRLEQIEEGIAEAKKLGIKIEEKLKDKEIKK